MAGTPSDGTSPPKPASSRPPATTAKSDKGNRDFLAHLEAYLARRDGVDKLLKISRYASKIILASHVSNWFLRNTIHRFYVSTTIHCFLSKSLVWCSNSCFLMLVNMVRDKGKAKLLVEGVQKVVKGSTGVENKKPLSNAITAGRILVATDSTSLKTKARKGMKNPSVNPERLKSQLGDVQGNIQTLSRTSIFGTIIAYYLWNTSIDYLWKNRFIDNVVL